MEVKKRILENLYILFIYLCYIQEGAAAQQNILAFTNNVL